MVHSCPPVVEIHELPPKKANMSFTSNLSKTSAGSLSAFHDINAYLMSSKYTL